MLVMRNSIVGLDVGRSVGLALGDTLGADVGVLGRAVGMNVGVVGLAVGMEDGAAVGIGVGSGVSPFGVCAAVANTMPSRLSHVRDPGPPAVHRTSPLVKTSTRAPIS